jgi:aspartyl aminopeptidase
MISHLEYIPQRVKNSLATRKAHKMSKKSESMKVASEHKEYASQMLKFIDLSPSPYHCAFEAGERLKKAGFQALDEKESWKLEENGKYFVIKGGSIIAIHLGKKNVSKYGIKMLSAHTDSPNLRIKPKVAKAAHGHLLFEVEPYGGLIVATWADRDLSLAGRVWIEDDQGRLQSKLVTSPHAICRIPNLAIHLNRDVNDEGLKLNKHLHLSAVAQPWTGTDPSAYAKQWLASLAGCSEEKLLGHDLCLFDAQEGAFSGIDSAYLQTGRLDNQASSYHCLSAMLEASQKETDETKVICLFDHEEVGSLSSSGADGAFQSSVLMRLVGGDHEKYQRMIAQSMQLSVDMAHALHPNFADRHDPTHHPVMNAGPVIKYNVNTKYATNGETSALFKQACKKADVPVQEFVNRPDLACGSTIGSISSAHLGMRTVDIGTPMWSMHSAREMAGTADQLLMHRALSAFLA